MTFPVHQELQLLLPATFPKQNEKSYEHKTRKLSTS